MVMWRFNPSKRGPASAIQEYVNLGSLKINGVSIPLSEGQPLQLFGFSTVSIDYYVSIPLSEGLPLQ